MVKKWGRGRGKGKGEGEGERVEKVGCGRRAVKKAELWGGGGASVGGGGAGRMGAGVEVREDGTEVRLKKVRWRVEQVKKSVCREGGFVVLLPFSLY